MTLSTAGAAVLRYSGYAATLAPAPCLWPLCCTLDYPALDDFIARFGRNLSRAGLFLPMREPLEVGSAVRFEVVLSDARVACAAKAW